MGKKFKPKNKSQSTSKKLNPFELHINHTKLQVLGQKNKNDRGKPGVARARANKIREKTLLDEYKNKHKDNVFKDRRIGENNPFMDPEKKAAMKMAREMRRQLNKKSLFNLTDDNDGLAEEKLNLKDDYNFSDDDDENPDDKQLDAKFVKEKHFGGGSFLSQKKEGEGSDEKKYKSKKERIDEIIAESKVLKANQKRDKEEIGDAVKKLDAELQTFLGFMRTNKMTDNDKQKAKDENEFKDYDKLTRELGFDRTKRGKAQDRLKTPEELAKEEKERLSVLESARLCRMMGEEPSKKAVKAVAWSADDLNDGFILNEEDKRMEVIYKEGKLVSSKNLLEAAMGSKADGSGDESEEDEDDEDNESGEDDDDDDDDNEEDSDVEAEEEGNESDVNDDESDKYSDILEDNDSEDEEDTVEESLANEEQVVETEEEKEKKKALIESAKKEIPFTFEIPQDYDSFITLLEDKTPSETALILQRMIACNHPSLGNNNSEKCQDLFKYLLQTIHVVGSTDAETFKKGVKPLEYLDSIPLHLYNLTQFFPAKAAKDVLSVIEEKYSEYSDCKIRRYPQLDTFTFLKLSGMLFPASDYQHTVMTPVITFLAQMLGESKLNTKREVTAGMFSATLLYEYIYTSKRYSPELLNFLSGIVFLSIDSKNKTQLHHHLPYSGSPFKIVGPNSILLALEKPKKEFKRYNLTLQSLNENGDLTEDFKVTILKECLSLLNKLCNLWSGLPAVHNIINFFIPLVNELNLNSYPMVISETVEELRNSISKIPTAVCYLVKKASATKSLKMLEPKIERILDGVKNNRGDKERQKLLHKIKQGTRSARKELKKDGAFIAKHRLKETLAGDAERKRKLNRLFNELNMQQSESNKEKLSKKRKF